MQRNPAAMLLSKAESDLRALRGMGDQAVFGVEALLFLVKEQADNK